MVDMADIACDVEEQTRQAGLAALQAERRVGLVSLTHCERCDAHIPVARQRAVAGVATCVACEHALELKYGVLTGRGCK